MLTDNTEDRGCLKVNRWVLSYINLLYLLLMFIRYSLFLSQGLVGKAQDDSLEQP